ncbi:hypothetical protein S40288_02257 [Stachybotrys chartarum IBT 40288]|nr:hypothetical protein S40288_02257 [Stachybotrys chartarum IBT 40288]
MRVISFFMLYLPLLLIIARFLLVKFRRYRQKRKAAALGCLPPPSFRSNNFLGDSVLRESIAATKADRGPIYVVEKMDGISPDCHTAHLPILDYEVFITRAPENIRTLFSSPDFDISSTRQKSWLPMLGQGIFTSRGPVWKHSRAMLRPQFAKELIHNVDMEEEHLQILLRQLPVKPTTGWTDKVDLGPLFFFFTLDVITEFVFGHSTGVLSPDSKHKAITHSFDAAKSWIDRRGALAKFYWMLNTKDFREHCKILHGFVDGIVAESLARDPGLEKQDPEKLERFNLLRELVKEDRDPVALRNNTLQVLVAGRDTTGSLCGWLFYYLARYPDVYRKLRLEIITKFGSTRPDSKSLGSCTYLQWVINETLRICPVIPMDERVALTDTTLPSGGGPNGQSPVFVPEGTQVLMPIYAIMHRRDLWHDAESFIPERWENLKPGWKYTPFAGGPRKCLGQQFAKTIVSYVIARFCQDYDMIENVEEGTGEIKLHHSIENRSGTGVQVRLHQAKPELSGISQVSSMSP